MHLHAAQAVVCDYSPNRVSGESFWPGHECVFPLSRGPQSHCCPPCRPELQPADPSSRDRDVRHWQETLRGSGSKGYACTPCTAARALRSMTPAAVTCMPRVGRRERQGGVLVNCRPRLKAPASDTAPRAMEGEEAASHQLPLRLQAAPAG